MPMIISFRERPPDWSARHANKKDLEVSAIV